LKLGIFSVADMVDPTGRENPKEEPLKSAGALVRPFSWAAPGNQFPTTGVGFFAKFPKPGGGDSALSPVHHTKHNIFSTYECT
jgi:hypothetical protein